MGSRSRKLRTMIRKVYRVALQGGLAELVSDPEAHAIATALGVGKSRGISPRDVMRALGADSLGPASWARAGAPTLHGTAWEHNDDRYMVTASGKLTKLPRDVEVQHT